MIAKKTPVKKKAPVKKKTPARKRATVKKPLDNNQVHGGARAGSGRKLGAATKRTRKIADDLAKDETRISPLDYMLETLNMTPVYLNKQLKAGLIEAEEYAILYKSLMDRRDQAAKDAAPYIHPRLSSITAEVKLSGHEAWQKELDDLEAEEKAAAAKKKK